MQFPDARIEYEDRDGQLRTLDLEVEAIHYRVGHAKTRKFFAKLERLGHVSTYDCEHNRARIYHVRHRELYDAIGEPESRLRRPPAVPRALERLMVLDAILEHPDIVWLSTPEEKVAHLRTLTRIPRDDLPHLVIGQGGARQVRYFPDRLPIGIHPDGRVVLIYLLVHPLRDELRTFLERHSAMLGGLPAWTVRIGLPAHLAGLAQELLQAAWAQIATPLRDSTRDEVWWYFEQLRAGRSERCAGSDAERFRQAEQKFQLRRYPVLYRAWLQDGERALTVASSHAIRRAHVEGGQDRAAHSPAQLRSSLAPGWRRLMFAAQSQGGPRKGTLALSDSGPLMMTMTMMIISTATTTTGNHGAAQVEDCRRVDPLLSSRSGGALRRPCNAPAREGVTEMGA